MAKRVEGVTEKLLECAKQEFLKKGYKNASLRAIAEKANSSKGAIYIRYPDKAALFTALVQDTIDGLLELIINIQNYFSKLSNDEKVKKVSYWSDIGFSAFTDYLYKHFDEFKLLISCSDGEMYQKFIHNLVDTNVKCTFKYVETSGNDAIKTGRLNKEFAHLVYQAFYTGVFEVIAHNLPKANAVEHINRLRRFYTAGWMTIFNPSEKDGD